MVCGFVGQSVHGQLACVFALSYSSRIAGGRPRSRLACFLQPVFFARGFAGDDRGICCFRRKSDEPAFSPAAFGLRSGSGRLRSGGARAGSYDVDDAGGAAFTDGLPNDAVGRIGLRHHGRRKLADGALGVAYVASRADGADISLRRGAGMVFPNLSAVALSAVPRERIGFAASLFNMMRNLGSAFGISAATNLLMSRKAAEYRTLLAHARVPSDVSARTALLLQIRQCADLRAFHTVYVTFAIIPLLLIVPLFWLKSDSYSEANREE